MWFFSAIVEWILAEVAVPLTGGTIRRLLTLPLRRRQASYRRRNGKRTFFSDLADTLLGWTALMVLLVVITRILS
jgi:hypothetical protein